MRRGRRNEGLCGCAVAAGSRAGSSTGAVPAIITGLTTGRFGESSGACRGTGLLLESLDGTRLGSSTAEGEIRQGFGIKATPVSSFCQCR